jgi:hypothetical protein
MTKGIVGTTSELPARRIGLPADGKRKSENGILAPDLLNRITTLPGGMAGLEPLTLRMYVTLAQGWNL